MGKKVASGMRTATAIAGLVAWAVSSAAADPGSPPNSQAKITVVYEFKGSGDEIPKSHERHVSWEVSNRWEVSATMTAQALSPMGGMHKADPKVEADMANRQALAASGAKDAAPMMAQAQAAAAKCGDDEACLQREVMKMAQGMTPETKQKMKDAGAKAAKAGAPMKMRYQIFTPGKQSGTFKIDEKAHEAYFDAACSLKNEPSCAFDTVVRGEGALTLDGKQPMTQTGSHAELDLDAGSLMFVLPWPGVANVSKTVTSKNKEIKTGTTQELRTGWMITAMDTPIEVKCGECRSAKGVVTKQIEDQLLHRKGTLTATWTFTRP